MATYYYRMQNCVQPDVYANAAFTSQQTIGQVYEMALVPPSGIIVDFCWKVDGIANDGISAVILNDYGLNNCSGCISPTPPPTSVTSYGWVFHQLQGNGSNSPLTSCLNCPYTVYSNVQYYNDLTCGQAHFYLDANLTTPFTGSNQYYSASPSGGTPAEGTGSLLMANGGVVTDIFDCNGNSNCNANCYIFTITNTGNPLDDDSFTYINCSGGNTSGSVPYGDQIEVCAKSFTHIGVSLTVTNTFTNCNTPAPIAPPTTVPVPAPVAPSPSPVPTAPVPAPVAPIPQYCLGSTNAVTIENLGGINKYVFGGNYGLYGSGTGTFVLQNVPSSHPIAFQNFNKTSLISYTGQYSVGTKTGQDGNLYEYFYGDVTLTATGNYGTISYECYNHGYMGGQNNLMFDNVTCPNINPPVIPPQGDPTLLYTLTFSNKSQGWTSFYSYHPDYMIGMNNYFYSMKGGNLYRHNTNDLRNNYYDVQYNSQIKSVFNAQPLENKIFKTINLESDAAWSTSLESDIQTGNTIDSTWFEKKEGAWFAYIRSTGSEPAEAKEYPLRSTNGIGRSTSVVVNGTETTINFSTDPIIEIGSDISVGDILYFALPPYSTIQMAGQVTAINRDTMAGLNNVVINNSITGAVAISIQDAYIAYIKNQQAESYGLLGHYCIFTITNSDSTATELFAVESEVMKSYP